MVTRKTAPAPSSETLSDTSNYSLRKGFWWSALRITTAVVVISGAYIAWVVCGTDRDDYGYYQKWEKNMQMMKYRGPMDREKMSMSDMMNRDSSGMMNSSGMMMSMSMADMGKMLEGKTGDALDKAFLEGMIPHHQAAIDMAKYLAGSKHPELVKLGADIIAAQMKEIEEMKAWQIKWGYISTGATMQTGTMMHMMPDGTMMQGGM